MYAPALADARSLSALESLALCFIAAVGLRAGAAYVDLIGGTFAGVLVVNTILNIAVDTSDTVFHFSSLL